MARDKKLAIPGHQVGETEFDLKTMTCDFDLDYRRIWPGKLKSGEAAGQKASPQLQMPTDPIIIIVNGLWNLGSF